MDKDRYLVLVTFLDNEMSRFWLRFNIFAVMQAGALVGLSASKDIFTDHGLLTVFMAVLMLCFSVAGAIVVYRGVDLQRSMVMSLLEVEKEEGEDLNSPSFTQVRGKMRTPMFIGNWACFVFSLMASVMWMAILAYTLNKLS